MKIKSLALIITSVALLASCGGGSSATSHPTGLSTEQTQQQTSDQQKSMLDFIDSGKIYFDVHDIDVKLTYGNAVLTKGSHHLALQEGATIAAEGTAKADYNFLYVFESLGGHGQSINQGIEPESLGEFLQIRQAEITGKTRVFVAISTGKPSQWTHGLNALLDENLTVWTGQGSGAVD